MDLGEIMLAAFPTELRLPQLRELGVYGSELFDTPGHLDVLAVFLKAHPTIEKLSLGFPDHLEPRQNASPEIDLLPQLQALSGSFRHIQPFLTVLSSGVGRPLTSLNASFLPSETASEVGLRVVGTTVRKLHLGTPFHVRDSFVGSWTGACPNLRYLRLEGESRQYSSWSELSDLVSDYSE